MQSRGIVGFLPLFIVSQAWISMVVAQMGMGMGMGIDVTRHMPGVNVAAIGQFSMLDRAVREIVHPNAKPTPAMIHIVVRQSGLHTTFPMIMVHLLPHMINLAYQHGVQPTGTFGRPGLQSMQQYLQQRVIQWMSGASLPRPVTAVQPPRSGNAATSPYQSVSLVVSAPAVNTEPDAVAARVAQPVPKTKNVVSQPQVVPKRTATVIKPRVVSQKVAPALRPQVVPQSTKEVTQQQGVPQKTPVANTAKVVSKPQVVPETAPVPQPMSIDPLLIGLSDPFAYHPAASALESYMMMGMMGQADMLGFGF